MANEKLISTKRFIDESTGEIFEAVIVGEPYWRVDRGFIKFFAIGLKEIANNEEIIGKAARLLLWILSEKLSWNSYEFYMTEKEAMSALKISRATYYRWLNALIKAGIIEKVATNIFRLKPRVAVKGQAKKAELKLEASTVQVS